MEDAGVKIDTYRMGEITARLADRVEELEARATSLAGEEFMLGSTQQVARILFEKLGLTPGRKGKTGYSTDSRVLRGDPRREHEIVPVIEEWREYSKLLNTYLLPLPSLISAATAACTRRSTRPSPPPGGSRPRTRTSRRFRCAPSSAARSGRRSWPRRATGCFRPTTARSSCASSPTSRASRRCARRSSVATTSTRATAAEVLGKEPATLTRSERDVAKMVNFGIIYGISSFGLSENLEIPREEAQAYIDTYLARFPHVPASSRGRSRRPRRRVRDDPARPPPPDPGASRVDPPDALARRAPRRQLGHAGNGRRSDQGGDDPRPRRLRAEGRSRAAGVAGARRAAARGARDRGERA